MSKPRTQEVDYFPHYSEHGKILFILENNFQNDGYAVFYKIQELLAKTNGHCYDCSSIEGWEYLLSKMNIPEEKVISIIEKLVKMGTLDLELWEKKRLWMQTFVDSIADAYARRKVNLPSKPDIKLILIPLNGQNVDILPTELDVSGQNVDINPQSKVKESKGNNGEDKSSLVPPPKKQKAERRKIFFSDEDMRLSKLLDSLMLQNNPNRKEPTEGKLQSWANEFRLMREQDKREIFDIEIVLRWSQADSFWKSNIESAGKLRKKYDQLSLRMREGDYGGRKTSTSSNDKYYKRGGHAPLRDFDAVFGRSDETSTDEPPDNEHLE